MFSCGTRGSESELLRTPAGVVLPTVSWALTLATNKENALQTCRQARLMGVFSQLKFLLPNDSGLCQVGIKLVSTRGGL